VPRDKGTPFGSRFIDIEISKMEKFSVGSRQRLAGSRYRSSQRAKDFWLRLNKYTITVVRDR
jgi:hypothetical protein